MDGGAGSITFRVLRVGDGGAALTNASTAVFLEEWDPSGLQIGNAIALPTASSGANSPLTVSGTATSEGGISRSEDGAYLVVGGYATAPGTAMVATSTTSTINRVVARIDAAGNVDTSTRLDTAFSGSNLRGAAAHDGSGFWLSGNSSPAGTGGVYYVPFGAVGGTQVLAAPNNVRWIHVFAGQLYGSSGSGTFTNVFTVGAGLPTMSGQTATSLPGLPTSTASPYSFVLLDRSPNVPGVDTLYLADDRSIANGGGIQKWTFDGAAWTLVTTFTNGITTGVRGLAGVVTGNDVTLAATTTESMANKLVVFVDDGAPSPMGTLIGTAPANTAYRGVAPSPK